MDNFDRELMRRLRNLPVPPPSAGFAARALRAGRGPAWRPAAGLAVAAALAAAVALPTWIERPVPAAATGHRVVAVAPGDVQPVSLMFRSPRSLTGVTITLQLPEGVELAGHPARRELAWQADLQAGANRLDLPVVVRHGGGGVLTAQLAHGRDRRQIAVLIEPRRDPAPPAGGASVADGFTSA